MSEEQTVKLEQPADAAQQRQRSSIAFPYADLEAAVKLAIAVHQHVGTGECGDDQLAAWTDQSPKSSGFRTQVYAARMFGVLDGESGKHRLSDLGRKIIDPSKERAAKIEAFLSVPLYLAVYEHFKGHVLPPPAAFERELVNFGVSEKVKDRARQVLERSAEQAGFFEQGRNKLVAPGVLADATRKEDLGGGSGSGGGGSEEEENLNDHLDPVIAALVEKLPPAGSEWDAKGRVRWLRMIEMAFQEAYGEAEEISISVGKLP